MSDENAKADVESGVYTARRSIKPGDVVLDCGAHIGYFTRLAASQVGPTGTVIAFEPHPRNYRLLLERVGDLPNVFCVNAGAMSSWGIRSFYELPGNTGGNSFFASDSHKRFKEILTVDIGYWLGHNCFTKIDFAKIDTEGAEVEILVSLLLRGYRPHVAVEVHNNFLYETTQKLMLDSNYSFEPNTPNIGVCYGTPNI